MVGAFSPAKGFHAENLMIDKVLHPLTEGFADLACEAFTGTKFSNELTH